MGRIFNFLICGITTIPLVTLIFINGYKKLDNIYWVIWLIMIVVISNIVICLILLYASKNLNSTTISVNSIEASNSEIISSYSGIFLPLFFSLSVNLLYVHIISILMYGVIVFKSNIWCYNPLFRLFTGYKVYKITNTDNITYIMLSKLKLRDAKQEKAIVRINDNMVLGKST